MNYIHLKYFYLFLYFNAQIAAFSNLKSPRWTSQISTQLQTRGLGFEACLAERRHVR